MTPERIEITRKVADELAREIHANNDQNLYRQLMGLSREANNYNNFRTILIRAIRKRLHRTNHLMLGLDDYVSLFEQDESIPKSDWKLVRDLIRIRVMEQLYQANFFAATPEILEEEAPEE